MLKFKVNCASTAFLLFIMVVSIIAFIPVKDSLAKPVVPNENNFWPDNPSWGTDLLFDNTSTIYVSQIWFGVGTSEANSISPPDPPSGLVVEFLDVAQNSYFTWVHQAVAEPASYTWQVQFRKVQNANPDGGTVSSTLEDSENNYVPPDFSVVIENTDLGIHINLRAGPENIHGANIRTTPITANLYVDNAVNIQSIDNLDPLTGIPNDNLRLNVFVKNTGRYTDNYVVSTGGSLDPTILNLAPGNTDNVILNTNLPNGTENVVITAAGNYASDQGYVTVTGQMVRKVNIQIIPDIKFGDNGENLTFDVIVKNTGDFQDSYTLTMNDNAVPSWGPTLDDNSFDNVLPGENRTTILTVMIPDNASPGDSDNITVTVTTVDNAEVGDNASCIARMGSNSVAVSILPGYQDNAPGGTLKYTVMVSNTGTLNDSYDLTFADNTDGATYWEDNISLDNSSLTVPAGGFETTILTVIIPDDAVPGTDDNITVTVTSQSDNSVSESASCIANVARLTITISPEYQSGLPGATLFYTVYIKNNENVDVDYHSVVSDNFGWNIMFGIKRVILSPLGEAWTILKVTISENAIGGTDDEITVTMVSFDNTLAYSASSIANVTVVLGVKVSITPSENSGAPGDTVNYLINVQNTGNVQDNYALTASDDAGWGLAILPPSLIIPPQGSENATLSVTIPENATALTLDNIIVTATSQENENVSADNTCTALALAVSELHLLRGWNLVGFQFTSGSTTPRNLFPGLTYLSDYIIYYWNAPTGPYALAGIDQVLQDNIGYWLYVAQDNTIKTSGIPLENREIDLVTGWNLVHFPVIDNTTTPANVFTGMTYLSDYIIYYWNAPTGPYSLQGVNQVFEDNRGYWVYVNVNKTVTVP